MDASLYLFSAPAPLLPPCTDEATECGWQDSRCCAVDVLLSGTIPNIRPVLPAYSVEMVAPENTITG